MENIKYCSGKNKGGKKNHNKMKGNLEILRMSITEMIKYIAKWSLQEMGLQLQC